MANHDHHQQPPAYTGIRIPRPLGITNLSLMGKPEEVLERITREYLQGNFPRPGSSITLPEFKARYKVPHHIVQRCITEAFTISPQALFDQGTIALEKALGILANPQAKASKLTEYLEAQVYGQNKQPGHLLVQNLIGSINLERQGADTIVKFIEKAISSDIVRDAQSESLLSREDAIAMISENNMNLLPPPEPGKHRDTGVKDLTPLEEAIAADPNIPDVQANIGAETQHKRLPRVNSDYDKRKDVEKPKVSHIPTILPK